MKNQRKRLKLTFLIRQICIIGGGVKDIIHKGMHTEYAWVLRESNTHRKYFVVPSSQVSPKRCLIFSFILIRKVINAGKKNNFIYIFEEKIFCIFRQKLNLYISVKKKKEKKKKKKEKKRKERNKIRKLMMERLYFG